MPSALVDKVDMSSGHVHQRVRYFGYRLRLWESRRDPWLHGASSVAERVFRGSMDASDPRLDGHVAVHTRDASGAVRIQEEQGTWSDALGLGGDVAGMPGASRFGAWLVGEDAYEGLNAFMYAVICSLWH